MDATRFDSLAKLLAGRFSRRRALSGGGAGLAAGVLAGGQFTPAQAQDATPDAERDGPTMLYIQSFQAGSVVPKDGAEGRYTLTLEQGLGHTVFFSDRPDRIFGSMPTPRFLAELGFPDDNPPNAALVVEAAEGQTEVAVVELFDPTYDEASRTATYEVAVLAEWEREGSQAGEAGFSETTADLATLLPTFGAAHLFIDDYVSALAAGVCYSAGCGACNACASTTDGLVCYETGGISCHPDFTCDTLDDCLAHNMGFTHCFTSDSQFYNNCVPTGEGRCGVVDSTCTP